MTRIPDEVRAEIAEALSDDRPTRAVASQFGVSEASVRRIARAAGIELTREQTQKAVHARQADMARRRAELAYLLLEDAHRLRVQLWEPAMEPIVVSDGKDGSHIEDHPIPRPRFKDQQAIATAVGISLDKHLKLVDRDASPDLVQARSLLDTAVQAIRAAVGNGDELVSDD